MVFEFLAVGDPHFTNNAPSCRIDDYQKTCEKKLDDILEYATLNDIDTIIILGDFWHKPNVSISIINSIANQIDLAKKKYSSLNGRPLSIYCIYGNHDLPYENYKFVSRSPLETLFIGGVLKRSCVLSPITGLRLAMFDYGTDIKPITSLDEDSETHENMEETFNICFAHAFYENGFGADTISSSDAKRLGYNAYMLGHDHLPYSPTYKYNYVVYRFGSLLRNSSLEKQADRIPAFLHATFDNELKQLNCKTVPLPSALPKESVFSIEALERPIAKKKTMSLNAQIESVLSALNNQGTDEKDMSDLLGTIPMSEQAKDIVLHYMRMHGVA